MKSLNANTHLFQVSYLVRMFSSAYEQQTTYHSQALCSRCVIHGTHSSWGSPRFISTWHSEIIFLWCLVAPFTVGSARGLDSYILHPWLVTWEVLLEIKASAIVFISFCNLKTVLNGLPPFSLWPNEMWWAQGHCRFLKLNMFKIHN